MKCKQCHYWGDNRCYRIGHTSSNPNQKSCVDFDYWRNYQHVMDSNTVFEWEITSGEVGDCYKQQKLF